MTADKPNPGGRPRELKGAKTVSLILDDESIRALKKLARQHSGNYSAAVRHILKGTK